MVDPTRVFAFNAGQDVWAVGPHGLLLQHWGAQWTAIDCGTWVDLQAAWSGTANEVWLFGDQGTILHWDGQRCAAVDSSTKANLYEAWGSSASDVWAAGSANTIVHWDGKRWVTTQLPGSLPHPDEDRLKLQFAGSGPSDVWVLGRSTAESRLAAQSLWHWTGAVWQPVAVTLAGSQGKEGLLGNPVKLTNLWTSEPGDLWLAGIMMPYHAGSSAFVLRGGPSRWRLARWLPQNEQESFSDLEVWGRGPREVYVNGSGGDEEDCSPFERCAHWDGKHWTTTESACERASGLAYGWTVGDHEGQLGILHRDGQQTQMILPQADFAVAALWPSSRGVVYVLGNQRDLPNGGIQSLLLRWDGNRWLPRIPIADVRLQALWGSGDELWAVGSKGAIWHFDGQQWEEQESGNSSDLYAVWGSSPHDLWAAGAAGTLLHFRGQQWTAEETDAAARDLHALWGSGPRDLWAAGNGGTLLHFDGNKVQPVVSGTTAHLAVIDGSGASDVWIGGAEGTLLHFTGAALQPVAIEAPPLPGGSLADAGSRRTTKAPVGGILALKRRGPQELWVACGKSSVSTGRQFPLWRWNGALWSPAADTQGTGWQPMAAFSGTDDLWALGPPAALYHYRPAGRREP